MITDESLAVKMNESFIKWVTSESRSWLNDSLNKMDLSWMKGLTESSDE